MRRHLVLLLLALLPLTTSLALAQTDDEDPAAVKARQDRIDRANRLLNSSNSSKSSGPKDKFTDKVIEEGWQKRVDAAHLYLEIPLHGEFGKEIDSSGVSAVLDYAQKNNINDIVFRLNSPGGNVQTADEILSAMRTHPLTYHCLTDEAISASIWVVFGCDTIHVADGSTIGGAVVFHIDSTGQVQVDAKFNSIVAARLSSMAEAKGRSPALVRAMTIQDAVLYFWHDADGKPQLSDTKPKDVDPDQITTLDDEKTVLTLTAKKAVEIGLATRLNPATLEKLGADLKIPNWTRANNYAPYCQVAHLVRRAIEFSALRLSDQGVGMTASGKKMLDYIDVAMENEPEQFIRFQDPSTHRWIVKSVSQWQDCCSKSLEAWRNMHFELHHAEALARASRSRANGAQASGAEQVDRFIDVIFQKYIDEQIQRIDQLRQNGYTD